MKKLTDEQVLEIRSKREACLQRLPGAGLYTQPALALEYGVSVNTIRSIEKGLSYREVGTINDGDPRSATAESISKLKQILAQDAPNVEPTTSEPEEDPLEAIMRRRSRQEIPNAEIFNQSPETPSDPQAGSEPASPSPEPPTAG